MADNKDNKGGTPSNDKKQPTTNDTAKPRDPKKDVQFDKGKADDQSPRPKLKVHDG